MSTDTSTAIATDAVQHLRHEALIGGVSNALFNGAIAWLLLRGGPALTWSGESSFVVDIVATAFILPFIVALIVIPLQQRKLNRGDLSPLDLPADSTLARLAARLSSSLPARAFAFGLIGALVIAPVILLIFKLAGVTQLDPASYALLKGLWAGALAAILVVPMVVCALGTRESARADNTG